MSRTTFPRTAVSRVEPAARARYEAAHPGRSWDDAPAYLRDRARLAERQLSGVADDE
ncbi:hypothetical protein ACFXGA_00460 [Actinosynnema sp. NPDC059335]|uniref:hypothetical protein n=1 Tax=Actinosynnema sp. NPDC059335 TaxID=3346804 RepID=UPI00366A7ED3